MKVVISLTKGKIRCSCMQRYFVKKNKQGLFLFDKEDSYHIVKVMRMNVGEQVEVVSDKVLYIASITDIKEGQVVAKEVGVKTDNNEMKIQVTLAQSLVKEQKMDFILQKATELGVHSVIPLITKRSVIKVTGKEGKKLDRWNKITKEASEQAKRNIIPEVKDIITISDLCKLTDYDIKILCTVRENSKNIKKVLSKTQSDATMLVVVGPEGGFTDEEENIMIDNGFITVSLGNTVLRSETVALFLMSVIHYHDMR